jgi:hypothetical protein
VDRYEVAARRGRPRFVSIWSGDALLGAAEVAASGGGPDVTVDLARLPAPASKYTLDVAVVEADKSRPVRDASITLSWGRPALLDEAGAPRSPPRTQRVGADGRAHDALEAGSTTSGDASFAPRVLSVDVGGAAARPRGRGSFAGAVVGRVWTSGTGRHGGVTGAARRGRLRSRAAKSRTTATQTARSFRERTGPLTVVATRVACSGRRVRARDERCTVVLRAGVLVTFVPRLRGQTRGCVRDDRARRQWIPVIDGWRIDRQSSNRKVVRHACLRETVEF